MSLGRLNVLEYCKKLGFLPKTIKVRMKSIKIKFSKLNLHANHDERQPVHGNIACLCTVEQTDRRLHPLASCHPASDGSIREVFHPCSIPFECTVVHPRTNYAHI